MPEQAQGVSRVLQLSNSSSWQILQIFDEYDDLKSSINNTIPLMFSFNSYEICSKQTLIYVNIWRCQVTLIPLKGVFHVADLQLSQKNSICFVKLQ